MKEIFITKRIEEVKHWFFENKKLSRPNSNGSLRVPQNVAKAILLANEATVLDGTMYYFEIKNLGLGVCSIGLAPRDAKETKLVKEHS